MMRLLSASVGFAVLSVMAGMPAIAQPDGTATGGIVGDASRTSKVFPLIRAEAVQNDLALTRDQKRKLAPIIEEFDMAAVALTMQPIADPGRDPSSEQKSKFSTEVRRKTEKLIEEKVPAVTAVLTAEQFVRLNQIILQTEGGNALHESDVRAKLALTSEQQRKLLDISNKFNRVDGVEWHLLSRKKRGNPPNVTHEMIVKERDEAMISMLTPLQVERFQSMRGKEFDIKVINPHFSPMTLPSR